MFENGRGSHVTHTRDGGSNTPFRPRVLPVSPCHATEAHFLQHKEAHAPSSCGCTTSVKISVTLYKQHKSTNMEHRTGQTWRGCFRTQFSERKQTMQSYHLQTVFWRPTHPFHPPHLARNEDNPYNTQLVLRGLRLILASTPRPVKHRG